MNETPFKFTSEEKEQTLQILERLRTAVGDTFKPMSNICVKTYSMPSSTIRLSAMSSE